MPTTKELQEQRAPLGLRIRQLSHTINAEQRDFTTSERSEWDRLNADFDRLTGEIDTLTRAEGGAPERRGAPPAAPADRAAEVGRELERRRPNPPGTEDTEARGGKRSAEERDEAAALAIQGWVRAAHGHGLTPAQRRACKRVGLNPNRRAFDLVLPRTGEKRALSGTVASAGAYTVPSGFVNTLEKAMKDYNGVRAVADVIRTDDGRDLPWPTVNDTANKGRRIGESEPVVSKDPPFGRVVFGAYKYTSDLVLVPFELLEDSAVNFADELGVMLGERIGRAQEEDFTVGTGASQPHGIAHSSVLGKTAATNTGITGDDIIDLIHSVDPVYRRDPSFALMMHDLILAVVRKVKDGQGRYLFEEGQNGAPSKLKGVPIVINQNMPSAVATGNKTMLAGPFKKYKVRDVNKVRIKRLDERWADNDQVGFLAFMRSDGRMLNAGTGPIKHLVHP